MCDQGMTAEELLGPLNTVEKKNAPACLFVAGDPSILNFGPRVSLVGSRKATALGLGQARALAGRLVERGVVVVSGLAEGIDAVAHTATIQSGGKTVAVLGTSLDQFYPASNRTLQEQLMQDHLVVSQFALGVPSRKGNFPMRNRTMALISDATVIVEAGEGSGSLHQGWEALRLGRPLFIMEPLFRNRTLKWPAEMAGYGAEPLSIQHLEALFDHIPPRSRGATPELAF